VARTVFRIIPRAPRDGVREISDGEGWRLAGETRGGYL